MIPTVLDAVMRWVEMNEKNTSEFFNEAVGTYMRQNTKVLKEPIVSEGETFNTRLSMVLHYGEKEVIGAEEVTRLQYVSTIQLEGVPTDIEQEIQNVIKGLCAQESSYHNGLESPLGAKGIFQFMPATWEELEYQESDIKLLKNQVVTAGTYLS